ncbi:MAG: 3D domain-containing protein [bacterium]|nr:3D domain-containing protein [bacterium]
MELIYPQAVLGEVLKDRPIAERNEMLVAVDAVNELQTPQAERLPEIPDRVAKKSILLTVTAYSSSPDETQGDPFITASGKRTSKGTVAYNHLPFGTKVRMPDVFGEQIFRVEDRLPTGAGLHHVDMWMPSKQEAKQWGVRVVRMEIL